MTLIGTQVNPIDTDLTENNIRSGVEVFGVEGSLEVPTIGTGGNFEDSNSLTIVEPSIFGGTMTLHYNLIGNMILIKHFRKEGGGTQSFGVNVDINSMERIVDRVGLSGTITYISRKGDPNAGSSIANLYWNTTNSIREGGQLNPSGGVTQLLAILVS